MSPLGTSSSAPSRFLSQQECSAIVQRVARLLSDGRARLTIRSSWRGTTRLARNYIASSGETRDTDVALARWSPRGAVGTVAFNQIDDAALDAAVRRSERLANRVGLLPAGLDLEERTYPEAMLRPTIWSDATYNLSPQARADVVRPVVAAAERAGMIAFGYIEVAARGSAIMETDAAGWILYYPYTEAQYSVTVRDPQGTGAGWAGQDHYDWTKLDTAALTARALEKCLRSRNPVAVEPGRYTTILEPQAVADFIGGFFSTGRGIDREWAELKDPGASPFWRAPYESRLGERVFDERLTFESDPMDLDLGVPPFVNLTGDVEFLHPATWVKDGVLQALSYSRHYGIQQLGKNTGLVNTGAVRMRARGPATSVEEMISTTPRGILVTRFWNTTLVDIPSWAVTGGTRDGVWLIEDGKLSKAVKNFRFNDSVMAKFNAPNLEQIGTPVRVFSPGAPMVVPPVKVRDFNFTSLVDAV